MRLHKIASIVALAGVLTLTGCAQMHVGEPGATVAPPDAQPDSEVPDANVPIADVAPEAAGVNEGNLDQGSGVKMSSDVGKGDTGDDVTDSSLAGGCLPGYGGDGVCLPPIPPRLAEEHAGHVGMLDPDMAFFYTCEDVRALIPKGLVVQDKDYIGLDTNGDGMACGEGD